jgi:hypothetical protein
VSDEYHPVGVAGEVGNCATYPCHLDLAAVDGQAGGSNHDLEPPVRELSAKGFECELWRPESTNEHYCATDHVSTLLRTKM